ncbi:MAG: reverse transcriptase-like protein [Novosphingobium sp.]
MSENRKPRRRLKVFFDGGCRPNPGRIEAAVVVRGVTHLFEDLGHGTNSDAEWLALICALELTRELGLAEVELIGDAAEVILQATQAFATGRATHHHAAALLALCASKPVARIRWIKRAQNLAGIALAGRHPR